MGKSPILIRDEDVWSFLIRRIGLSIFSLNFIGGLLIAYVATRDISYVTSWWSCDDITNPRVLFLTFKSDYPFLSCESIEY